MIRLESIEPCWAGRRCIVAASGPSLTPEVAEMCRGELVVAVNDAYRLMPWADVLYACDLPWWRLHDGCPGFAGEKWTSHSLSPKNDKMALPAQWGVRIVAGADKPGFSLDPAVIHYGNNSGFQGVNAAILKGADPIVLVGFDMREVGGKTHFFGRHRPPLVDGGKYGKWCRNFATAAKLLDGRPRIVNVTPGSALTCFPAMPLAEALAMAEAA